MENEENSLRELARLFTKLGLTAFGGPAAHIAMMQKEVVDKRNWMDHDHFLDLIGAILYGSGYVLFAFLDSELVAKGLLSRTQLIDAIAVGQFTPGPVFSSVTFIGWQMNGLPGAVMATIAVFLPSFVFVALLNPLVPRMRRSRLFSAFLDGVNIASVAIIITVCISFARETVTDWRTILIAGLSGIVTFGFRNVNTVWIVLGSGIAGYILLLI